MQSKFSAHSLESEFARITQQQQQPSLKQSLPQQITDRVKLALQQSATALLHFLTGQQTLSIKTRQHFDKATHCQTTQWIVYDPRTDHRQVFDSQQAVRAWIEERYHR